MINAQPERSSHARSLDVRASLFAQLGPLPDAAVGSDCVGLAPGRQAVEEERSTEWDEKARAFKLTPAHNWASHGADGWRISGRPPRARG